MKVAFATVAALLCLPLAPVTAKAACVPFETHGGLMTCKSVPEVRLRYGERRRDHDRDQRNHEDRDRRGHRSADRGSGFESNFAIPRRYARDRHCYTLDDRRIRNHHVVIETHTVCHD